MMERTCGQRLARIAGRAGSLVEVLGLPRKIAPLDALFIVQRYYGLVVVAVTGTLMPQIDSPQTLLADGDLASDLIGTAHQSVYSSLCRVAKTIAQPAGDQPVGDAFKPLYENLFPRPLRHAMGEYYTPDWLAAQLLDAVGFDGRRGQRLADPACGSGTFLIQAIGRVLQREGQGRGGRTDRRQLLDDITQNIAGIELNPLAALTARANYLLAVRTLLDEPLDDVPIAVCDSILDRPTAPAFQRPFDFVVGNPPWVAWDNLPADYREATRSLWGGYGLFSLDARAARHGGGKKDLAMLMLYVAADRYLKSGGRLGMVLTQTLLQSKGAGDGFRRFQLGNGDTLGVVRADDFVAVRPFDAANWTCTLVLEKGRPTQYPVPYHRWTWAGSDSLAAALVEERCTAQPVDAKKPTSPWLVQSASAQTLSQTAGPSDYRAYLGANSGGANGVYWVELLGPAEGGIRIRPTLPADTTTVNTEFTIEPDLLYPLLRWGDVARFDARCGSARRSRRAFGGSLAIIMAQDPATRTGIEEQLFAARWPQTLAYLKQFEPLLRGRAAYRRYQAAGPFYAMYNVGPYTVSPIKVVWRRMDKRIRAAVVEPIEHPLLGRRPVVPQETCVLVPFDSTDEAHYLCALMNSTRVGEMVSAHSVSGGKGFGTPSILDYLSLHRFDPADARHQRLVVFSRQAHAGQGGDMGCLEAIDAAVAELSYNEFV